jgi:hypothetical protein
MASKKRAVGTTPIYQELPADLLQRLRGFARRDQRTLKVKLTRAIEMLPGTYDNPEAQMAGAPPSAKESPNTALPTPPTQGRGE